jgi:Ca2+-binding RTX toxin-like protein
MAVLVGTNGNDSIGGTADFDLISGGAGSDTLSGGDLPDDIHSASGAGGESASFDYGMEVDFLFGGAGNDRLFAGYGDKVDGGAGSDFLYLSLRGFTSGVQLDFRVLQSQPVAAIGSGTVTGVEYLAWVEGTQFDDYLVSDTVSGPTIDGLGGNDHIIGIGAWGYISGGDGNDLIEAQSGSHSFGGAGNDTLVGGSAFDVLYGGDGNDVLTGGALNDILNGGEGNDTFDGGAGGDTLEGEGGDDLLTGGGGNDRILGGTGNDTLLGGAGVTYLNGEAGDDWIDAGSAAGNSDWNGGFGNDTLSLLGASAGWQVSESRASQGPSDLVYLSSFERVIGSNFNDQISGGDAGETLEGAGGDDTLFGGSGNDALLGGAGSDIADFSGNFAEYDISYNATTLTFIVADAYVHRDGIDSLQTIESLKFADGVVLASTLTKNSNGAGNDTLMGTAGSDLLKGLAGNDSLSGAGGNDTLIGGTGDDVMDGGEGTDFASYAGSQSSVVASLALTTPQATGGAGIDTLINFENLVGGDAGDTLIGNALANRIEGGAGSDVLDGGAGIDTLVGGSGYDVYVVDQSADVVVETDALEIDTIKSSAPAFVLPAEVESLQLLGALDLSGRGNDLDNTIIGNSGSNVLEAMGGDDVIAGGAGNDTIYCGAGDDDVYADANEFFQYAGAFNDWIEGGAGNDELHGGEGDDTLVGDSLTVGGAGDDDLSGEQGLDTVVYAGNSSNYVIAGSGTVYTVSSAATGTDSLRNIEFIRFADRTVTILDSSRPAIVAVTPASGATNVPVDADIVITVSEVVGLGQGRLDISSTDGDYLYGDGSFGGQWTGTQYTINPAELKYATTYVVTMDAGLFVDATGNQSAGSTFSFTTKWIGVEQTGSTYVDFLSGNGANDTLHGAADNDVLRGRGGDDLLDGGAGIDTARYSGDRSSYTVLKTTQGFTVAGPEGSDTLIDMERLEFADVKMALDIGGTAGQAYRLYQAAFDRAPDSSGLGFHMSRLDWGWGLGAIAQNFIDSPEFSGTYGALDNASFVTQLYANVLHREPDAGGLAYHVGRLETGVARASILVGFSESPENQAALLGVMENGIVYT